MAAVEGDREAAVLRTTDRPIWSLLFSPDGRYLAARQDEVDGSAAGWCVWDWAAGRIVAHDAACSRGVAFSAGGDAFAVGDPRGGVSVYALPSGERQRRVEVGFLPHSLAFHPKRPWLAVSGLSSTGVVILSFENPDAGGARVAVLTHPAGVRGLAWSPDGELCACACDDAEHRILVWDVERQLRQFRLTTGQLPRPSRSAAPPPAGQPPAFDHPLTYLHGHAYPPTLVAFNHGGDLLASTGWDGAVCLWDPWTGRQLVEDHGHSADTLLFSRDDRRLAARRSGGRVGWWEVQRPEVVRTLHTACGPYSTDCCVDFSPDGGLLASLSQSDCVELLDPGSGDRLARISAYHGTSLLFDPHPAGDGPDALLAGGNAGLQRWTVRRDPQPGGDSLTVGERGFGGRASVGGRLACSADGGLLAMIAPDYQVALYKEAAEGAPAPAGPLFHDPAVRTLLLPTPKGTAYVAVSPDGRFVATGCRHGAGVQVWNARTGQIEKEWPDVAEADVAFSPDGRWLVAGAPEQYLFWRVGGWEEVSHAPRNCPTLPGPAAFTRDGRLAAVAASYGVASIVEVATGRELVRLEAPNQQRIGSLRFSPDGTRLAAADVNLSIEVWDIRKLRRALAELNLDWEDPPPGP